MEIHAVFVTADVILEFIFSFFLNLKIMHFLKNENSKIIEMFKGVFTPRNNSVLNLLKYKQGEETR